MSETIGFIGLGNMGLPMARNLLEAGHALRVFNRTASKAAPLVSAGATAASSPREAAEGSGIVITSSRTMPRSSRSPSEIRGCSPAWQRTPCTCR